MSSTEVAVKARHRFTRDGESVVCSICGFTIGSITHSVQHSNMSIEYAVRKGLTIRCQCSLCGCWRRVKAAKSPLPACGLCLRGTHNERGLNARQMFR